MVYCSICHKRSDRGCIQKCRRCSGMSHKYLRACDCKGCTRTFHERQQRKLAKATAAP